MTRPLNNPTVRLALRALLAGLTAAGASYQSSGTTIAWHGILVAGALAFAEVFTPLNALVGAFKTNVQTQGVGAAPALVAPPASTSSRAGTVTLIPKPKPKPKPRAKPKPPTSK